MRQVWKPFEWAEMPRMACIETGRPIIFSCRRPAQSVQGMSSTTSCSKATSASSRGDPPDRVGGDARFGRNRVGRIVLVEEASGQQLEDRVAPATVWPMSNVPDNAGVMSGACARRALPWILSKAERLALAVAGEQAVVAPSRDPRSPARGRSCSARGSRDRSSRCATAHGSSAPTKSPSVPGLMPTHSSAIAP